MSRKEINPILQTILGRSVPGGGFSEQTGSEYRVDATALAVLALKTAADHPDVLDSAQSRLTDDQLSDGRVCFTKDQPQVYWPTPLAILAWHRSVLHRKQRDQALQFLLVSTGILLKKENDPIVILDASIPGWSWTEGTFSWVEPTSLAILALSICGYASHARVREGVRLLMDRQLSSGGWNYGNTIVYGQELYPQPGSSGMALTALAGQVEKKEIKRSLDYLKSQVVSCRTPLSLGWALFGLGAWDERPTEARRWIVECLSRQNKIGGYGTTLLSLLFLAYKAKGGFTESIS
jgi:hypothetical protein